MWDAVWQPFGGLHSLSGTATLSARFPGQWFQAETGLHYNWHRSYDPTLGRYTQPDPLGFVDGPSVYGYGRGSPLRFSDKNGLTTYVFVNTGGTTGHTGVLVVQPNGGGAVFDPGGSFLTDIGQGTGSFLSDYSDFNRYKKYFTDDPSSQLTIYELPTTPEEEEELIRRFEEEDKRRCGKGECTLCTSRVLKNLIPNLKDLPEVRFPSALGRELYRRRR